MSISGHSITGHKSQGMTVRDPRVLVTDLRSAFTDALSYVISSRIESIEQIFFVHSLPRKKFKCSQTVLEEIERLQDISINNNPTAWFKEDEKYIKISSINVYKLGRHIEDLKSDVSLMKSSIICCVETWLDPENLTEDQNKYKIEGFSTHLNSVGPGKGMAIFSKPPFSQPRNSNGTNFQITKMSSPDLDVICVYRSSDGSKRELLSKLLDILTFNKASYICGDFNICLFKEPQNVLTDTLEENNFVQIVQNPTFKIGSLLDHGYIRQTNPFTMTTYAPYWSDHDAVLLVVHKESNGTFEVKQKASRRKSDSTKKTKGSDSAEQNRRIDSDLDDMDAAMEARMKAKRKDMGHLIREAKRKLKAKSSEYESTEKARRIDSDIDDIDAAMEAKLNAKVKDMGQLIKEAKRKLKAKQSEPVLKKRKHESDTDD